MLCIQSKGKNHYVREGKDQQLLLFHKIVYDIHVLVVPFKLPRHGYNLRNVGNFNFVIPKSGTISYYAYNRILLSTTCIQPWNN